MVALQNKLIDCILLKESTPADSKMPARGPGRVAEMGQVRRDWVPGRRYDQAAATSRVFPILLSTSRSGTGPLRTDWTGKATVAK